MLKPILLSEANEYIDIPVTFIPYPDEIKNEDFVHFRDYLADYDDAEGYGGKYLDVECGILVEADMADDYREMIEKVVAEMEEE